MGEANLTPHRNDLFKAKWIDIPTGLMQNCPGKAC